MLWVLVLLGTIVLGYWFLIRPFKYWSDRGVPQGKPVPLFGDYWGIAFKLQSFPEMVQYIYNMCPKSKRYSGFYQFPVPTLLLKDPKLIKQITVKHFNHFLDHSTALPDEGDLLWANTLFALKGDRWHKMRAILSPTFTSSKIRQMFVLMCESAKQFNQYFLKKDEDIITVEMKDIFARYTNNVIANAVFGINCDSLEDRNNEFYLMGREIGDPTSMWRNIKMFGYMTIPWVYKFITVSMFPTKVSQFFINLVNDNIEKREKFNIVHPDLINILLETRKHGYKQDENKEDGEEREFHKPMINQKIEITDLEITAQGISFFISGFDTVSTHMSFMAYELGVNPEVQERLIREVDEYSEECGGQLTYEILMKMKYMDMVISEVLRKWPNAVATERLCIKSYTIEPECPEETELVIDSGTAVWIPIYALHHDPNYFPNPENFDPERFNDENKSKIIPYTYLPFGAGPRNCVASRFALLETKALFFYILSNFEIVPVARTEIQMKLSKRLFLLAAENGFWFGLKRRVK